MCLVSPCRYHMQGSSRGHFCISILSGEAMLTIILPLLLQENALLTFQSANDEVNDVQWCPTNSTVFGTATSGGKVEIWDLAVSTLKPVAQHSCDRIKFACMLFCEESPVVVAGGSNGGVQVLRLVDVELADDLESVQTKRLNDAMRANIVKTGVVNVH